MNVDERFLSLPEVQKRIPYSKNHIYRLIREGQFPKQVKIGVNRVAWVESEIMGHMEKMVEARNAG